MAKAPRYQVEWKDELGNTNKSARDLKEREAKVVIKELKEISGYEGTMVRTK